MCAAAISLARIRRLYFGAYDPKGGGVEHGPRIFDQPTCHHRPEVYGGIDERRAGALLRDVLSGAALNVYSGGNSNRRCILAKPRSSKWPISHIGRSSVSAKASDMISDAVELAAQPLDAAGQVDVGPDHGEIEPVARADIAVGHRAVMQRDAGAAAVSPGARRLRSASAASPAVAAASADAAGLGGAAVVALVKDRQHAVAHDLDDLAAMRRAPAA